MDDPEMKLHFNKFQDAAWSIDDDAGTELGVVFYSGQTKKFLLTSEITVAWTKESLLEIACFMDKLKFNSKLKIAEAKKGGNGAEKSNKK
jgi:hypothetical protein